MNNIKDMATKQVLLELRKKVNQLIADAQMEDPDAAADGEADADEAMDDMGDHEATESPEELAMEGEGEPEDERGELRKRMLEYMNPKPNPRRPGTAMMIAMESKKPASNKGRFGKLPRKDIA